MSGFVDEEDVTPVEHCDDVVEVREGRSARIGSMGIVRALPTKGRRTVGGWCLLDVMLPGDELDPDPLEIGPHPHIGLSTVTWILEGEALHSDSLGTEQLIRPGELNLMTAGYGVAHAELGTGGGVRGIQMWVAQPESTRHGPPAFEHHAELPGIDLGDAEARVFVGTLGGAASPARIDSPLVGADVEMRGGSIVLDADPTFEYGVVPVDGRVRLNGAIVEEGFLGLITAPTRTLHVEATGHARFILIGGEPLEAPLTMWWNFVARSKDEITEAWRDWQAGDTDRYPEFRSVLDRIEAPTPPWVRRGA
jgi:redox-sensitive bicupin YhaK (pirin superfamily)